MGLDRSELSSLCALLAQLTGRVTAMGEAAAGERRDDVARELFAAERALEGARRRLERLGEPPRARRA